MASRINKPLSNRQKNLLVFIFGFVVGMAAFWGVMWGIAHDYPRDYEGLGYGLMILTSVPFYPVFYLLGKVGFNIDPIWYSIIGCGIIFGVFFVLFRWSFLQIKNANKNLCRNV